MASRALLAASDMGGVTACTRPRVARGSQAYTFSCNEEQQLVMKISHED